MYSTKSCDFVVIPLIEAVLVSPFSADREYFRACLYWREYVIRGLFELHETLSYDKDEGLSLLIDILEMRV
jgi:hypothetical protein